jgi:hypothetical protein
VNCTPEDICWKTCDGKHLPENIQLMLAII